MADFESVTWNDDDEATPEKLNQMAQNDDYLLSKAIPMLYRVNGLNKSTGLKICAGISSAPVTDFRQTVVEVHFGGFFTAGCTPIVLVSGLSTDKWRAYLSVTGLAQGSLLPTDQGFRCVVSEGEGYGVGYLAKPTSVSWCALGY